MIPRTPLDLKHQMLPGDLPTSVRPDFNVRPTRDGGARSAVDGKFLRVADQRFNVKGVTYGTFAPDHNGHQFPQPDRVAEDFAAMPRYRINTIRTYTVPDSWLLDEAGRHGLQVMVGIPWAQHVAFLDERDMAKRIRRDVAAQVQRLAGHPAVLLIALGNEIPAPVVRWHGRARVERFLRELYDDAKAAAPETLFTYVNYPPTEYLDLPFFDVCAFNVYLHRPENLRPYLARLQHLAGPRPLLLAEAGADSIREGDTGQADLLSMQLRAMFAEGACGAVAFTWTDEWWRGGHPIDDWAFGLVDRERRPKPALAAVARVFAEVPFPEAERRTWPKVSVVVCAYNAADTIHDCLASLERLTYPDYEIIVVNDGSRDETGALARRHPTMKVIDVPNGGLSAARNIGLAEATGEIVAYTDADVRADPDWLSYLIQPFVTSDVVGSGGPNVVPPDDSWVAQCVARAPGGPTHVLLDDRIAEHVPGCNMAFRRDALNAIGGFNPIYLRAGDDVDLCWRLQKQGWQIGYAAAALVWHRHRGSIKAYWKQQAGYGEGQQWLMPHHPDKFSGPNILWRGHIYNPLHIRSLTRPRINTGPWGTAPFPSVYQTYGFPFAYLPHSVVWQAGVIVLFLAGMVAVLAGTARFGVLLATAGATGLLVTAARCVRYALASDARPWLAAGHASAARIRLVCRALIAWLYFIQPLARARGRLRGFLSPHVWRNGWRRVRAPRPSSNELRHALRLLTLREMCARYWSERWTSGEKLLTHILNRLRSAPATRLLEVDDGWQVSRDISVSVGPLIWLDLRALVEDHGSGRCLVRIGERLRPTRTAIVVGAAIPVWLPAVVWAAPADSWTIVTAAGTMFFGLTFGRVVWRVAYTVAVTERTIAQVAAEDGMLRLPDEAGQQLEGTHPARLQKDAPAPAADPFVFVESKPLSIPETKAPGQGVGGRPIPRPVPAAMTLESMKHRREKTRSSAAKR